MAELKDRAAHEQKIERAMNRLQNRHKRELAALLGDPPDPMRVPPAFWAKVERETEEELLAALVLIFVASSGQHGMQPDLGGALGQRWAASRAAETGRRAAENARDRLIVETIKRDPNITKGSQLAERVFPPGRPGAIAVTETTGARTAGILAADESPDTSITTDEGEQLDPLEKAELVWELEVVRSVERHCSFCPLVSGTGRDCWGLLLPSGPAAHVNCACGLVVQPPKSVTASCPATDKALSAARDSGVFGF